MRSPAVLVSGAFGVLVLAGCAKAPHIPLPLRGAYDSAVNAGEHLHVPDAGDVGLAQLDRRAVRGELGRITALVPRGAEPKSVLETACDAKSRYETGTATTYDQAAAAALQTSGVHVSTASISRIEQHLIHAAESSNPVPATAAAFACSWAQPR